MPELEYHALVEFINRLFTGVVAVAVIAAVAGSVRRQPRRRDLTWLSLGLVCGVLAQVVLGALLVRTELDPRFTMGHFLLSMVLLWNAVLLDARARRGDMPSTQLPHTDSDTSGGTKVTRYLQWAVFTLGGVLLVSGTLVTGAGPHAGDSRAQRLPLLVHEVARIHGILAITLFSLVMWTWWRMRTSRRARAGLVGTVAWLLVLQGVVGYTQYFFGVPAALVGVHIVLACLAWIAIARVVHDPSPRGRPRTLWLP